MITGEAAGEIRAVVPDVPTLAQRLAAVDYLVDQGLAMSLFLSLRLPQPLLLEGEAGVGKTEAAKAVAQVLDTPLVRLQCYEGIDAAEALYEWNYPRQLLSIRLAESSGRPLSEQELFGPDYLIRRPLLRALEHPGPRPAVLLIDEIDRADDDFEAFLLELLGEAAVNVPSSGTVTPDSPSTSKSSASNSSSARSISSMSSTGGTGPVCRTARRIGRSSRNSAVNRSSSASFSPRDSASRIASSWRR